MLSISQFSKISHIPTKTLRYYDEIGVLEPFKVNQENGYRYYLARQLSEALLIQKLKSYQFTLEEIRGILQDASDLERQLKEKQDKIAEKIIDYTRLQAAIESDIKALAEGEDFMFKQEVIELVESPEMNVLAIRKVTDVKNIAQMLQDLMKRVAREQVTPAGAPMFIYHSEEYTPESYDVEVALPIVEATKADHKLPATSCARYAFKGNYEKMPQVYVELSQWIEKNQLQLSGAPFDSYETDPSVTPPDENRVDVYFPVEKS